eukprot:8760352-Heterocapsa_arctica.AAC.1
MNRHAHFAGMRTAGCITEISGAIFDAVTPVTQSPWTANRPLHALLSPRESRSRSLNSIPRC